MRATEERNQYLGLQVVSLSELREGACARKYVPR